MERLTIRSKNSDMVWFKDAENEAIEAWNRRANDETD